MPLESGSSDGVFSNNVKKLMDEGYPQKQALAIAYNNQRKAKKVKKSDYGISDNDKYLENLEFQTQNLEINDSRHIEVDSRYNIFLIKVDSDLYTGWIYLIENEEPILVFRNYTLSEIIAQAYGEGVFVKNVVGDSYYNQQNVSAINNDIYKDLDAPPPILIEEAVDTSLDSDIVYELEEYLRFFIPKMAMVHEDSDGRSAYIKLVKSLVLTRFKMNDPLIKSNYQLWPTINDSFSTKLDDENQDFLKKESDRLKKSTDLEFEVDLKKSESKDNSDKKEESFWFDNMTKTQSIQRMAIDFKFSDPDVTL